MISRLAALGLLGLTVISLSACKTLPSGEMTPAILKSADESSMSAIKAAAAEILGRSNVTLGAMDLAKSSAVSVLPERGGSPSGAPFSQNDFAIPTQLVLKTDGTNCFLVKEDTNAWAQVAGVNCQTL